MALPYVVRAAVRRRRHPLSALLWLALVYFLCLPWLAEGVLLPSLAALRHGADSMRQARWTALTSGVALNLFVLAVMAAMVGRALRRALGLPEHEMPHAGGAWQFIRAILAICLGLPLVAMTSTWFCIAIEPARALALGLALIGLFVWTAPWHLWGAAACMAALAGLRRARRHALRELPPGALVHTEGTLVPAEAGVGPLVLLRHLCPALGQEQEAQEVRPFALEAGGARVPVEAGELVVECNEDDHGHADLGPGAVVQLIGATRGGGSAYRGEPVAIGPGRVYVFTSQGRLVRRLALAAAVNVLFSGVQVLCLAGLLLFWSYAGVLATGATR